MPRPWHRIQRFRRRHRLVLPFVLGTSLGVLACERSKSSASPADADPPSDGGGSVDAEGNPVPDGVVGGVLGGPPTGMSGSDATTPGARSGPTPDAKWQLSPQQQARVDAIRDREMAKLERDPDYQAYLMRGVDPSATPEQAYAQGYVLGHVLARRGIARLDDESLRYWSDTRLKMAGAALEICVGLWTGVLPPGALDWSLSQLPDDELARMMQLTADGGLAELHAQTPLQPDPEVLALGIERIGSLLSEADRTRFFETMQGARNTAEDQCFVVQQLHGRIGDVESPLRERFLRALAIAIAQ